MLSAEQQRRALLWVSMDLPSHATGRGCADLSAGLHWGACVHGGTLGDVNTAWLLPTASASPLPGDPMQRLQLVNRSHFRNNMDSSGAACIQERSFQPGRGKEEGSRRDKGKREVNTAEETNGPVCLACQEEG